MKANKAHVYALVKPALIVGYLVVLIVFVHYIFQFQFGGYDMSAMIDLCKRLHDNQRPGLDFISTFPLGLLFWIKINYLIFKNNYDFLIWCAFTHFIITLFVVLKIINNSKRLNQIPVWPVILIFSIPQLVTNHIFHSTFSQYNCIVILFLTAVILLEKRITKFDYLIFFLFTGLTVFSKQNVGLFSVALCAGSLAIMYLNKHLPGRALLNLLVVFIFSLAFYIIIIQAVLHVDLNIFITTFTSIASRGIPTQQQMIASFIDIKKNLAFTLLSLGVSIFIVSSALRKHHHDINYKLFIGFCAGIQLIGYYAFLTDWDVKLNTYPLVTESNLIIIYTLSNSKTNYRLFLVFVTAIFITSAVLGARRYRMRLNGEGFFYENDDHYRIANSYLAGLHCGRTLYSINNELMRFKSSNKLTSRSFFGPKLEFGYAQYNIPSPLHMPVWWHTGTSYNLKKEPEIIHQFKIAHFKLLVFIKKDRSHFPVQMMHYIDSAYVLNANDHYLDIYQPR